MNHQLLRNVAKNIKEQVNQVVVTSTPETHEQFFTKFGISNDGRKAFVADAISFVENNLEFLNFFPSNVPKIIHRMWLTNPSDPCMPPEAYSQRIARQMSRLGSEYHLKFWHNSDAITDALRPKFESNPVEFINIFQLSCNQEVINRISRAISEKKFVLAGDMSKFMILREFGGIYADLGIDFDQPLIDIAHCCGLTLFLDRNMFFQPAFMAAIPVLSGQNPNKINWLAKGSGGLL